MDSVDKLLPLPSDREAPQPSITEETGKPDTGHDDVPSGSPVLEQALPSRETGANKQRTSKVKGRIPLSTLSGAALSAVLLAFCFPFASFWWLAWAALVPWYYVLTKVNGNVKHGFQCGFVFGLVLHLVGMFWMSKLGVVPWAVLSVIEAGWFAVMGAVAAPLLRRSPEWVRPLLFAALWTLLEFARSWGSCAFPWFLLAATQVPCLPMVQIVSITGQWGLSFAVAAVNGYLGTAYILRQFREGTGAMVTTRIAVAIPIVTAIIGLGLMNLSNFGEQRPSSIGIVQGNVSKIPENADAGQIQEYRWQALNTYLQMTRYAASQNDQLKFILWPETVVPGYLLRDYTLQTTVTGLARETRTSLLVGTMDSNEQNEQFNSVVYLDADGVVRYKYAKRRLVPMGEFFLFRDILGKIYDQYNVPNNDLTPGKVDGVFPVGSWVGEDSDAHGFGDKIGMIICYESVFPDISRERVQKGAGVIVQSTSDETFDETPNPQQHADLAVLRAVETRRYFVRAGATGLSEVIDAQGHVQRKLPSGKAGTIIAPVSFRTDETLFVKFGDWFVGACALFTALAIGYVFYLRKLGHEPYHPFQSSEEAEPSEQTSLP